MAATSLWWWQRGFLANCLANNPRILRTTCIHNYTHIQPPLGWLSSSEKRQERWPKGHRRSRDASDTSHTQKERRRGDRRAAEGHTRSSSVVRGPSMRTQRFHRSSAILRCLQRLQQQRRSGSHRWGSRRRPCLIGKARRGEVAAGNSHMAAKGL